MSQLCAVVNVIFKPEDFISHFPERKALSGEGDHPEWVVCSDYKSPCPLRRDWIDPMPENSTQSNIKLLDVNGVCVRAGVSLP